MGSQKGGGKQGKQSCKADKTHDIKKSELAAKQRRWARGEFLKGEEHEQMAYQVAKDERDAVARSKSNADKAFRESCTNLESLIVLGDPHEDDLRQALRTHLDFVPNDFSLSEAGRAILRRYMELRATIKTAKAKAEEFRMAKAAAADLERKTKLNEERAARAKQSAIVGARCDAATERQIEEALAEVGGLMAFADL